MGARCRRRDRETLQQTFLAQRPQVDDLIADGNAAAPGFGVLPLPKNRVGQVLDREVAARTISGFDPAACLGVMGMVDFKSHGVLSQS